ncbi:MAG TPA: anti-sigma factor, partial [Candidatus Sabulitectum sp.]|nr:anti-sigma factor [Candidatus Sabulitectum sp.]
MSCPDRDELMRWLDGELPEGRRSELEAHLGSCAKCRSLIESQKLIEKVWRDSWQDPDDTAFEMMRRGILSRPPWWKRQRTWFAVAAVFSVYFGVRVFFLDGSGTPMARYAEEAAPTVVVTGTRPAGDEVQEAEIEEQEMAVEEENLSEQAILGNEETPVPEPIEETVTVESAEEVVFPETAAFGAVAAEGSMDEPLEVSGLAGLTGGAASCSDDEAEEPGYFSSESVSSASGIGAADASIGCGGGGSGVAARSH